MKNKWKKAIELFLYFFRIGFYTFGGGWSIVAQIQKDYVEGKKELTSEELLDYVSVGRSLPGLMVGNISLLFGYHLAGVPGAILSVIGVFAPPVLILTLVTFCYTRIKDNIYVAGALKGVRAAVAPIILTALLRLRKGAYPYKFCYVITLVACIGTFVFNIGCIWFVFFGGIMGLIMTGLEKSGKEEM